MIGLLIGASLVGLAILSYGFSRFLAWLWHHELPVLPQLI